LPPVATAWLSDLVGELSTRCETFRTLWAAHNVRVHDTGVKRIHHPLVGDLPHSLKIESESARALFIFTPGGIERMFEEGGVPAGESAEPPQQEYDLEAAVALSRKFGFDVVGPQVGNASS
jgi:hypothetical protein